MIKKLRNVEPSTKIYEPGDPKQADTMIIIFHVYRQEIK